MGAWERSFQKRRKNIPAHAMRLRPCQGTRKFWPHEHLSQRQVGHIKKTPSQHAVCREIPHQLEIAQDNRNLTREECWPKGELKKHWLMLASLESLRRRIRYLKGDANTAFFHQQAGFCKQKNFVPKLLRGDQAVTTQEDKQEVMFDYYDGLLGRAQLYLALLLLILPSFTGGRFYKTCWHLIKAEFMAAIITLPQGDAQNFGSSTQPTSHSYPRTQRHFYPKDFRTISLIALRS